MTHAQISNTFDIPLSTLNEWKNHDSNRYKLYEFLRLVEKEDVNNKKLPLNNHRIFHILNRNVNKEYIYSFEEIRNAFLKNDYKDATKREKVIYSKFFKECSEKDLDSFINIFGISIREIKSIYLSSPFRVLKGVAKVWDRRFRLKHIVVKTRETKPTILQSIINKRLVNV